MATKQLMTVNKDRMVDRLHMVCKIHPPPRAPVLLWLVPPPPDAATIPEREADEDDADIDEI